jgi:hypothetical protein
MQSHNWLKLHIIFFGMDFDIPICDSAKTGTELSALGQAVFQRDCYVAGSCRNVAGKFDAGRKL